MSGNFFSKLFSSRASLDRRTPVQLTDAVKNGDRSALSTLEQLAHSGNADAQLELGFLYAKGIGLPQSYSNAAAWYGKAADQGVLNAQYNLGVMYFKGEGVDQDYALALTCFEKAASKGHANAKDLASKLRPGLQAIQEEQTLNTLLGRNVVAGVKNDELANRYLVELKEVSESEDVRRSILTHLSGLGVSPLVIDEVQRCIELSKKFSSVSGAPVDEILQLAAIGDLDKILTKADDEDLTSLYNRGVMYLNGQNGVPRDLEMAYKTFSSAAEKGHVGAQHNLGVMYNTGTHVEKDPAAASVWFTRAAENGHANAAFNLAHMFLTGSGVEQSQQQAHLYLCMAADNGHPAASDYVQKFLASKGLDKNGVPLG